MRAPGRPEPAKGLADTTAPSKGAPKEDKKRGETCEGQEPDEKAPEVGRKYLVRFVLQVDKQDVPVAADVAAQEPSAAAAARIAEEPSPAAEMSAEEAAPAAAPPAPAEPAEGQP
jgi:hypothetical protein